MEILSARIVKLTADDLELPDTWQGGRKAHPRLHGQSVPDTWHGDYLELTVRQRDGGPPSRAVLRGDTSPMHPTSETTWTLEITGAVQPDTAEVAPL